MAKNKVSEWSAIAANNTDIGGIDIAEGCAPSGINNGIRELMAQVKDMITGADGDNFTVGGNLTLSGELISNGSAGTAGQVLTSRGVGLPPQYTTLTAFVTGMIMIWSGSSASIPSGWVICDGTNSTPDLRNRFVVGAGSTYAVGATGGSADAVVVSHTHAITDSGHTHTYNQAYSPYTVVDSGNDSGAFWNNQSATSGSSTTGISINSSGVSGTNANLPPYYALCYIMKT
jgi:microcystin-dependent protein